MREWLQVDEASKLRVNTSPARQCSFEVSGARAALENTLPHSGTSLEKLAPALRRLGQKLRP